MRRRAVGGLLLIVMLTLSAPAWSNYKEIYNQALEAVKDKNWPLAKALFEAAVTAEPKPKNRVRLYGMRYFSYLPYYNLARANFELKDCDGALQNAQTALDYGVVNDNQELAFLERVKSECQPNLVEDGARELLARLRQDKNVWEANIAGLQRQALMAREWDQGKPLRTKQDDILSSFAAIESRLGNPQNLTNDSLTALNGEIDSLLSKANDLVNQAQVTLRELERQEQQAVLTAQQLEAERKQRAGLEATLRARIDDLNLLLDDWPTEIAAAGERRQLEEVRQAYTNSGSLSIDQLKTFTERVNRVITSGQNKITAHVEEVASRPPDELVVAVDEFFKGNYRESISLLDATDLSAGRAGYYRRLFSAAAQFQLSFMVDSSESEQLKSQAQANLRQASAIETLQLDSQAFSPKFVEFANASVN